MLKLFKFMLAVIVLVILSHYYNLHKKKEGSRKLDKLDLIQEYLLNGQSVNSQKPILWIHNAYKINARNWESFKSRNTKDLNQPYLYLLCQVIFLIYLMRQIHMGLLFQELQESIQLKSLQQATKVIQISNLVVQYDDVVSRQNLK